MTDRRPRRITLGGEEPEPRLDLPAPRGRRPRRTSGTGAGDAFGHFAESFARFMGTPTFLLWMTVFVLVWIGLNVWGILGKWDPYPFILLNLAFSTQASYAAPLILLAQNRQDERDRVALAEDRARDERNLSDTEYLTREVAGLRLALRDVATRDFVRSELRDLLEELEQCRAAETGHQQDEGR